MVARDLFGSKDVILSPLSGFKRVRDCSAGFSSPYKELDDDAINFGRNIRLCTADSQCDLGRDLFSHSEHPAYPSDWRLLAKLARRQHFKDRGIIRAARGIDLNNFDYHEGQYKTQHIVGRGGFGRVWRTVQQAPSARASECLLEASERAIASSGKQRLATLPDHSLSAVKRHGGRSWAPGMGLNPWVIREIAAGAEVSVPAPAELIYGSVTDNIYQRAPTSETLERTSPTCPSARLKMAWRDHAGGARPSSAWELGQGDLGAALDDQQGQGAFQDSFNVKLASSALRCLHSVHVRGWEHGDIKVDNILRMDPGGGRTALCDWGCARRINGWTSCTERDSVGSGTRGSSLWRAQRSIGSLPRSQQQVCVDPQARRECSHQRHSGMLVACAVSGQPKTLLDAAQRALMNGRSSHGSGGLDHPAGTAAVSVQEQPVPTNTSTSLNLAQLLPASSAAGPSSSRPPCQSLLEDVKAVDRSLGPAALRGAGEDDSFAQSMLRAMQAATGNTLDIELQGAYALWQQDSCASAWHDPCTADLSRCGGSVPREAPCPASALACWQLQLHAGVASVARRVAIGALLWRFGGCDPQGPGQGWVPQAGTGPYRPPEAVDSSHEKELFGCWGGRAGLVALQPGALAQSGEDAVHCVSRTMRQCVRDAATGPDKWAMGLVLAEVGKAAALRRAGTCVVQGWRWWRSAPQGLQAKPAMRSPSGDSMPQDTWARRKAALDRDPFDESDDGFGSPTQPAPRGEEQAPPQDMVLLARVKQSAALSQASTASVDVAKLVRLEQDPSVVSKSKKELAKSDTDGGGCVTGAGRSGPSQTAARLVEAAGHLLQWHAVHRMDLLGVQRMLLFGLE